MILGFLGCKIRICGRGALVLKMASVVLFGDDQDMFALCLN